MIEITKPKDLARMRRFALGGQGLQQTRYFGSGLQGAQAAIKQLGYVQIDTISVVERAHLHVLHSRVPKFDSTMINNMLLQGDIFEYWSHAAAFLPIEDFRYSLPYKHAIKSGQTHWYKNPDRKLMAELLARIRSDGALRSRDLESDCSNRAGWWDWKPAKKALEQLYMEGELMVSHREGFQKIYDLTERVLPQNVDTKLPSSEELALYLLEQQMRCQGMVSLKGATYLRRNTELRKVMKALVDERLSQGVLQQLKLSNGGVYLVKPEALEAPLQRLNGRMLILSPFDNSVIQRERLRDLFDFDYQLECYLPEPKRKFGYFCLPLLYRGEFIGRMDCKAHRKSKCFEVKYLHFEAHNFDEDSIVHAFTKSLFKFCQFQKCDSISINRVSSKHLLKPMRRALISA